MPSTERTIAEQFAVPPGATSWDGPLSWRTRPRRRAPLTSWPSSPVPAGWGSRDCCGGRSGRWAPASGRSRSKDVRPNRPRKAFSGPWPRPSASGHASPASEARGDGRSAGVAVPRRSTCGVACSEGRMERARRTRTSLVRLASAAATGPARRPPRSGTRPPPQGRPWPLCRPAPEPSASDRVRVSGRTPCRVSCIGGGSRSVERKRGMISARAASSRSDSGWQLPW
jgi:hypothetical protein